MTGLVVERGVPVEHASLAVEDCRPHQPLAALRLRAEDEAVLLSVQAQPSEQQRTRLHAILAAPLDTARFWDVAAALEVHPLVAHTLAGLAPSGVVPPGLAGEAVEIRRRTALANLALDGELQHVGRRLHAAGVPAVPLKGTQLAQRLYGTFAARRSGDIDVFVQEEHLIEARRVLHDIGYALAESSPEATEDHPFHGVPYVRQGADRPYVVELHWGLSDPRFVTVDYARLWERILAGPHVPLLPLPAEETLIFLALHLAKHHLGVLRLLADVDRLVRRERLGMDWDHVVDVARRWNASWLLYFALHRSRLLLGTPLDEGVMKRLQPPAWRRALVGMVAGPAAVVRLPDTGNTTYNRFRLAYCAMLSPARRAVDAYVTYLFPPVGTQRGGSAAYPLAGVLQATERVGRGLARTSWLMASSIKDRTAG